MHPKIRRDLALLGELDHVDGRGRIALSAPPHIFCHNRPVISFHCEHRSDAEHDQNPDDKAGVPKESVDHGCDSSVETAYICANGKQSREMERRHENHFDRFDPPSYGYLAQNTAPAKRPTVGGKPVVQVKPSAPAGCKFVGTVKGTKLWAGDCTACGSLTGQTRSPTRIIT